MINQEIDKIILNSLAEDIAQGDITTESCVPKDRRVSGAFTAKAPGIVCGMEVAARVFALLDGNVKFEILKSDGESVERGDVIAKISGPAHAILSGERVSLNLLQRMSGIATATAEAVKAVKGTKAKITDTRKTTPGLRVLEKYAVLAGGGSNHRHNLADGILIKDNHIDAAGGITPAVVAARARAHHMLKIEVETADMAQVSEAISAGADIIMLDNMTIPEMTEAVKLIGGRALVEASGNMGEKDLAEVAATGVDLISIGALTHTITALDISLRFS